jgi:hypothetical protein
MPQFTGKSIVEDNFVEKLQEQAACASERRGAACAGEEGDGGGKRVTYLRKFGLKLAFNIFHIFIS